MVPVIEFGPLVSPPLYDEKTGIAYIAVSAQLASFASAYSTLGKY